MTNRRRPQEPPPIQIRQFATVEEIDQAIAKVRRRLEEVRGLDPARVRHDDPQIARVESNIQYMIREVFGENSPEYLEHGRHEIMTGPSLSIGDDEPSDHELQPYFAAGVTRTVGILENLIRRLEEKKADLGQDPAARARSAFEGMDLHPRIRDACADLYRDEHYAQAVFEASKALLNLVKEQSRRHDLDGASLMRTIFSVNAPVLAFNERTDQSEKDEQEGLMHLYEGAVLALRNPRGHAVRTDTPEDALEYLVLLSMLAKRADRAKRP